MGKWAARLAEKTAAPHCVGTDRTDKSGVLSVLAVEPMGVSEKSVVERWPEAATAVPITAPAPSARIYRLTRDQADEAHAGPWNDDTIVMFNFRRDAIRRRGYGPNDAEDLAEKLNRRDALGDDLRMCVECTHLGEHGRCLAAAAGRIPAADRRLEPDPVILHRCPAFGLRKGWQ